jgi:hypothetical protein
MPAGAVRSHASSSVRGGRAALRCRRASLVVEKRTGASHQRRVRIANKNVSLRITAHLYPGCARIVRAARYNSMSARSFGPASSRRNVFAF